MSSKAPPESTDTASQAQGLQARRIVKEFVTNGEAPQMEMEFANQEDLMNWFHQMQAERPDGAYVYRPEDSEMKMVVISLDRLDFGDEPTKDERIAAALKRYLKNRDR